MFGKRVERKKRQRSQQRASRTTNGVTTAAAATAAAVDENQGQHIVHPVAVRSAIPLKRKVREKEKRAGRKAYSTASALAVFRKARKPTRGSQDPRTRRSGVVNTKDKVRSWLERENPTRETIDSDNESNFPEEEINSAVNQTKRTSKSSTSLNQQTPERNQQQSSNRKSSSSEFLSLSPPTLDMNSPVKKMMRSISENPRHLETPIATGAANGGRHHFSRSISHGHEPDFSRLSRKTESHSHLLSKSELDLEPLGVSSVKPIEPQQQSTVTHPPVQKRIPNPSSKIPKSSTEGQLKTSKTSSSSKTKTFSSFEFLNLITGNKNSNPADESRTARGSHADGDTTSVKIRKKIGLGPVKVVLKWHGAGRTSRVKAPAQTTAAVTKSKADGEKRNNNKNNNKKKRVIVYKNGNPTANGASAFPAERKQSSMEPKPLTSSSNQPKMNDNEIVKDVGSVSSTKDVINITANPIPELSAEQPARPSAEAIFRSRRYSMQERLSQPPPLVRRVSEIHTSTSGYQHQPQHHNNSRRNRHSWTVGVLPEFPLNPEEISIDIEHDC